MIGLQHATLKWACIFNSYLQNADLPAYQIQFFSSKIQRYKVSVCIRADYRRRMTHMAFISTPSTGRGDKIIPNQRKSYSHYCVLISTSPRGLILGILEQYRKHSFGNVTMVLRKASENTLNSMEHTTCWFNVTARKISSVISKFLTKGDQTVCSIANCLEHIKIICHSRGRVDPEPNFNNRVLLRCWFRFEIISSSHIGNVCLVEVFSSQLVDAAYFMTSAWGNPAPSNVTFYIYCDISKALNLPCFSRIWHDSSSSKYENTTGNFRFSLWHDQ